MTDALMVFKSHVEGKNAVQPAPQPQPGSRTAYASITQSCPRQSSGRRAGEADRWRPSPKGRQLI